MARYRAKRKGAAMTKPLSTAWKTMQDPIGANFYLACEAGYSQWKSCLQTLQELRGTVSPQNISLLSLIPSADDPRFSFPKHPLSVCRMCELHDWLMSSSSQAELEQLDRLAYEPCPKVAQILNEVREQVCTFARLVHSLQLGDARESEEKSEIRESAITEKVKQVVL